MTKKYFLILIISLICFVACDKQKDSTSATPTKGDYVEVTQADSEQALSSLPSAQGGAQTTAGEAVKESSLKNIVPNKHLSAQVSCGQIEEDFVKIKDILHILVAKEDLSTVERVTDKIMFLPSVKMVGLDPGELDIQFESCGEGSFYTVYAINPEGDTSAMQLIKH